MESSSERSRKWSYSVGEQLQALIDPQSFISPFHSHQNQVLLLQNQNLKSLNQQLQDKLSRVQKKLKKVSQRGNFKYLLKQVEQLKFLYQSSENQSLLDELISTLASRNQHIQVLSQQIEAIKKQNSKLSTLLKQNSSALKQSRQETAQYLQIIQTKSQQHSGVLRQIRDLQKKVVQWSTPPMKELQKIQSENQLLKRELRTRRNDSELQISIDNATPSPKLSTSQTTLTNSNAALVNQLTDLLDLTESSMLVESVKSLISQIRSKEKVIRQVVNIANTGSGSSQSPASAVRWFEQLVHEFALLRQEHKYIKRDRQIMKKAKRLLNVNGNDEVVRKIRLLTDRY